MDRGKEATAPPGSRWTWRAMKGGRAPEVAGSGFQMHTQGRHSLASATERLRESAGVTQLARLAACEGYSSDILSGVLTGLVPAGRAHIPSLGSESWGC